MAADATTITLNLGFMTYSHFAKTWPEKHLA
jgi:hypothetical protein